MQFLIYFLLVLPSLAFPQPPQAGNEQIAINTRPRRVAHQFNDRYPDNRRRSQDGQNMDGLSSSPRASPSPPKLKNSHPQQDIARPSGSSSPPPWPPRPGTFPHAEISPVVDGAIRLPGTINTEIQPVGADTARPPYAPSSPRQWGTLKPSQMTPAEVMAGAPSRPSSPPPHQAITISEITPVDDPAAGNSPPVVLTPHSPPPQQHAFEIDTPQRQSAMRRRCAAIVHAFNTGDMTEEEKSGAAFCCRFLLGACMIGGGAGARNSFGAGIAVGGAVQWAEALQKLAFPKPKKNTETSATHTATPTATSALGSPIAPGHPEEPLTRRRGWKQKASQKRATPPRVGPRNQLETAAAGDTAHLLPLSRPSPPSPKRQPQEPSPPRSPSTPRVPPSPCQPNRKRNPDPSNATPPSRTQRAALSHQDPESLNP